MFDIMKKKKKVLFRNKYGFNWSLYFFYFFGLIWWRKWLWSFSSLMNLNLFKRTFKYLCLIFSICLLPFFSLWAFMPCSCFFFYLISLLSIYRRIKCNLSQIFFLYKEHFRENWYGNYLKYLELRILKLKP